MTVRDSFNYVNRAIEHAQHAAEPARRILERNPVFLDTETTGLSQSDQICDIAVVDHRGHIPLDTYVRPTISIPPRATRVHGITDRDVRNAPLFDDVLPALREVVRDRVLVIYNAAYDLRLIRQSTRAVGIADDFDEYEDVYCAMLLFAQYYGDWSDYHQSYTWQKLGFAARLLGIPLPTDLHRARAAAMLARAVLM